MSTLLTTDQAAAQLNVKPATLAQWRWRGVGPAFVKLGRTVRYRAEDVEAFIAEGLHAVSGGAA